MKRGAEEDAAAFASKKHKSEKHDQHEKQEKHHKHDKHHKDSNGESSHKKNNKEKGVQAKAPEAFAGRKGYTTPLRATNRVLTGPFKTDAEARAYVNQLARKGVSAFSFTSDAGQKVSRLGEK